jgi:hypothetical protein
MGREQKQRKQKRQDKRRESYYQKLINQLFKPYECYSEIVTGVYDCSSKNCLLVSDKTPYNQLYQTCGFRHKKEEKI